jgi:hypothetical protein
MNTHAPITRNEDAAIPRPVECFVPHKRLIRVFPRRTNATPDDDMVVIGRGPDMFDEADEVHVSVAFEWDIPKAEDLARQWERVAPVSIGGPAYRDFGGEFEPGRYLKDGYVITSRGCPNACWFCKAWRNEGREVRELTIKNGWNILDNNILATSEQHQEQVFNMLARQKHRAHFTGGLEAARLTQWHVEWLARLRPKVMWFAYDEPRDYEPLVVAASLLREAGFLGAAHETCCYVLIGYKGDTIEAAEKRLRDTVALGFFPQAMFLNKGKKMEEADRLIWNTFARSWAGKIIVGSKMKMAAA